MFFIRRFFFEIMRTQSLQSSLTEYMFPQNPKGIALLIAALAIHKWMKNFWGFV